jgi:hypothetical protein
LCVLKRNNGIGPNFLKYVYICATRQNWNSVFLGLKEGCQIFLVATYQNGKNISNNHKYTEWPQSGENGRKIHAMAIKFTIIFHCMSLPKFPKF